jgi:hypothetical protein
MHSVVENLRDGSCTSRFKMVTNVAMFRASSSLRNREAWQNHICFRRSVSLVGVLRKVARRRELFFQARIVSISRWTSGFENHDWRSSSKAFLARKAYVWVQLVAYDDAAKQMSGS